MNVTAKPTKPVEMGAASGSILDRHPRHRRHDAAGAPGAPARHRGGTAEHRDRCQQVRSADRRHAERLLLRRRLAAFRGIDISPNRKPIEPIRKLVAAFRRERLPVIWVNWGVRKDLLTFTRHCGTPTVRAATSPG